MDTKLFVRSQPGGMFSVYDAGMAPGDIFYVDSTSAAASDAVGFGRNPDAPFKTLDYAVGQCTASKGDMIIVMPGHIETVAAASGLDFDVAGIKVIGLGWGDIRPKVQLSAQASTVEFNADDMWIENLIFEGTFATGVTVGLDIKTGCDDLTLKNCTIRGTAAANELLKGITIEATNDRITIDGCEFFEFMTGDATAAIFTEGAFTNLTIQNCTFKGDWSVACIDADAAAVTANGLVVRDIHAFNTDATAGSCFINLHDTTEAALTNIAFHGRIGGTTIPIPANQDGKTSGINCLGCEDGGTYGVNWPLTATNYAA
jgi:hypothetical protein